MRLAASIAAILAGAGFLACPAALPRATPASQGVSVSAIRDFLDRVDDSACGMRAFMLLRHGKVVAEGHWRPFEDPGLTHALNEASGGVIAMAVALAAQEGRLSLDDHVSWVLPKSVPATADERLRDLRLRDLLSMSACAGEDAIASMLEDDPVSAFLAAPVAAVPGRSFRYFRANDAMLVQILAETTHERMLTTYLRKRLFGPLGIENVFWQGLPNGTVADPSGLRLTAEDFAKLAQLLLQGGRWNGRSVLPGWFVPQATTCQTPYGRILDPVLRHQTGADGLFSRAAGSDDWRCGYGFGFWLGSDGSYRMSGAYGQMAVVWPQHDLVFVSFAGAEGANAKVLEAVRTTVLPELSAGALPEDAAAGKAFAAHCAKLELARPRRAAEPTAAALARAAAGCVFPANPLGIKRLKYEQAKGMLKFENTFNIQEVPLKADGSWSAASVQLEDVRTASDLLYAVPGGELPAAASGAWTSPTRFEVRIVFLSAPLTLDLTLDAASDPLKVACVATPMRRYDFSSYK